MPNDVESPGRLRNILDDPFVVINNRETLGGELLLTFDTTPGTWMYEWDNDMAEDAKLAVSAGFVFRHLPTTQDAAIGILANGRTLFAFPGGAPAGRGACTSAPSTSTRPASSASRRREAATWTTSWWMRPA